MKSCDDAHLIRAANETVGLHNLLGAVGNARELRHKAGRRLALDDLDLHLRLVEVDRRFHQRPWNRWIQLGGNDGV